MTSRLEQFSEHARRALALAHIEARRLDHGYIDTGHILLGLVQLPESQAVRILSSLNIDLSKLSSSVELIVGRGDHGAAGEISLADGTKRAIELAVDESQRLDYNHIGTEHLLIALMREGEGAAASALESLGVTIQGLRIFVRQEESVGIAFRTGADRPMITDASDTRRRAAGRVAGLYVIVDPEFANGRDVVDVARAALRGGATAIQLRDKLHDKGDQLPIARALRDLCEEHNASFIVNDHADLAVASNAHGLHVGRHDLPVPEARAILHPHQFIGTSNALLEEALESIGQQADYLAVGAMYSTGSKDNTRPAGVEALRLVRARVEDIPLVAIGGINLSNVDPLLEADADGICVISAVCQADDPEDAARQLVQRIAAARASR